MSLNQRSLREKMKKQIQQVNLDKKTFRSVSNSGNGEVTGETLFHYQQNGTMVMAKYGGGTIRNGNLLGQIDATGTLTFAYQHFNVDNEFRTGRCIATPEKMPNGKLRYHESWEWTGGLEGQGQSIIEEI